MCQRARYGCAVPIPDQGARTAHFFGFYANAFALLREAYAELAPDPTRPFNTIEDALVPQTSFATIEQVDRHEDLGLRQRGFEELHSNHALMWANQNVELPPQLVHAGEQFVHPHLAEGGVRVIGVVVGQVPHPGKGRDRGCLP
jgi:hypothetical protein